MSGPGIRPPIFLVELQSDELCAFSSTEELVGDLEAIDVENGEYRAFDAEGRRLSLVVHGTIGRWRDDSRIEVSLAEETPSGAEELSDRLRRFLDRVRAPGLLDRAPLATLVMLAEQMLR